MIGLINIGLIAIPSGFLLIQIQRASTAPDNLSLLREVGTFVVSIILAWAVKYVREARAEVRSTKLQIPSAKEVKSIQDDYIVIKADLALMTDSLERTRKERDEAYILSSKATEALENANRLLEEERSTNAAWGRASAISDEKIRQLELQVAALRIGNELVDKFALQFVARLESLLVESLAKSNILSEVSENVEA